MLLISSERGPLLSRLSVASRFRVADDPVRVHDDPGSVPFDYRVSLSTYILQLTVSVSFETLMIWCFFAGTYPFAFPSTVFVRAYALCTLVFYVYPPPDAVLAGAPATLAAS